MKRYLTHFFHFLGSLYLAIILIGLAAVMVIFGTLVESIYDSHEKASRVIYGSPFFLALLVGFFINIFCSALRRCPFKKRHIPFLITHFGLLMIIGGTLLKQLFGLQGSMILMEGATGDQVMIAHSKGLLIEPYGERSQHHHLRRSLSLDKNTLMTALPNLKIEILNQWDNCIERYEKWFKDGDLYINGIPPIKGVDGDLIEKGALIPKTSHPTLPWDLYAIRSKSPNDFARKLYLQDGELILRNRYNEELLWKGKISDLIDGKHPWINLKVNWKKPYHLSINIKDYFQPIEIALEGPESLENKTTLNLHLPFTIELKQSPAICFVEDLEGTTHIYYFDEHGLTETQIDHPNELKSVAIYDDGFGGYTVHTELPLRKSSLGLCERRNAKIALLSKQMREALAIDSSLSPPLQHFKEACQRCGMDFIDLILKFLDYWDKSSHWIFPEHYPLSKDLLFVFEHMDWALVSRFERGLSHLISDLFKRVEADLVAGNTLSLILEELRWPLQDHFKDKDGQEILETLTKQIISLYTHQEISYDSEGSTALSPEKSARLFSAYLRTCSVHLANILPQYTSSNEEHIVLETTLSRSYQQVQPSTKVETNIPKIQLLLLGNDRKETIELAYDPYGQGLRWPALNGTYLIRFQPLLYQLPFKIKLLQARQVNYLGSSQAYSYEASLRFTDKRSGESIDKIVSMNHVHETPEGYRFYLSNITPSNTGTVKKIQLVVNYDPARYWLTYPGGLILAIGIILLFWSWNLKADQKQDERP